MPLQGKSSQKAKIFNFRYFMTWYQKKNSLHSLFFPSKWIFPSEMNFSCQKVLHWKLFNSLKYNSINRNERYSTHSNVILLWMLKEFNIIDSVDSGSLCDVRDAWKYIIQVMGKYRNGTISEFFFIFRENCNWILFFTVWECN